MKEYNALDEIVESGFVRGCAFVFVGLLLIVIYFAIVTIPFVITSVP